MSLVTFSLKPFHEKASGPDLKIDGSIGRRANMLSIGFALRGDLSKLAIPANAASPERKDRLWEETCLELFLGVEGSDGYREFNLSPAGHWNVYRFTSYREGMRAEPAFASLPFGVRREPGALSLSLDLDVGRILPADKAMEAAACAVVRTAAGGTGHWAVTHPGPKPDFHRRDGFVLNIPAAP